MNTKILYNQFFCALLLFLFYCLGHANQCAFDLPPNEQLIINSTSLHPKSLTCTVETNGEETNHLLSFVSETNKSVVNRLALPEGTIMSLSFSSLDKEKLTLELPQDARLGITNDSAEFMKLHCSSF